MSNIISSSQKPCSICKEQKAPTEYHHPKGVSAAYCKQCMIDLPAIQEKLIAEGQRLCTKCGNIKPLNVFTRRKASKDGYGLECKPCKKRIDLEKHEQLMASPRLEVTEKKCSKCKKVRPASEFYEDTGLKCSKDMLAGWCKKCWREYANVRANQFTYEQHRTNHIRKYGITRKEYNLLLEEQNGLCAICKLPETKVQYSKVMELGIDHHHVDGQVRGLLCADCNRALGLLKDDVTRIIKLLQYAQKPLGDIKLAHLTKAQRTKLCDEMFESQNGVCAVCELPETAILFDRVKMLALDHCHKTNSVRSLLCQNCNRAFGLLKDSPEIIESALTYIQSWAK